MSAVERPRKLPGSVLFVCSENALRSPMAEALMKERFGSAVFIDSGGVRNGDLDPMAIAVLGELGIDLSRHKSKRLDDLMDTSFDVIVTLSPEAHHKAIEITRVTASEVEYWPTPDPSVYEGSRNSLLAGYRELRDYLIKRIGERFGEDIDERPNTLT